MMALQQKAEQTGLFGWIDGGRAALLLLGKTTLIESALLKEGGKQSEGGGRTGPELLTQTNGRRTDVLLFNGHQGRSRIIRKTRADCC